MSRMNWIKPLLPGRKNRKNLRLSMLGLAAIAGAALFGMTMSGNQVPPKLKQWFRKIKITSPEGIKAG